MAHSPGASRLARLSVSSTLLLAALASNSAAAETGPVCHRPNGPRCVAAERAQRSARRSAHWAAVRIAPALSADGATLTWSAVPGVETYVVIRIVPGKPRERHVVTGTSFTPHETHGVTAEYLVRTHVARSHWSTPVSISYAPRASHRHGSPEAPAAGGQ